MIESIASTLAFLLVAACQVLAVIAVRRMHDWDTSRSGPSVSESGAAREGEWPIAVAAIR